MDGARFQITQRRRRRSYATSYRGAEAAMRQMHEDGDGQDVELWRDKPGRGWLSVETAGTCENSGNFQINGSSAKWYRQIGEVIA